MRFSDQFQFLLFLGVVAMMVIFLCDCQPPVDVGTVAIAPNPSTTAFPQGPVGTPGADDESPTEATACASGNRGWGPGCHFTGLSNKKCHLRVIEGCKLE